MIIKNTRSWSARAPSSYLKALLGVVIALLIRVQFHSILDGTFPMIFFMLNTVIVAYLFGQGPAFFSLGISLPLAYYFFVPPYNTFAAIRSIDYITISGYVLLMSVIITLIEKLQRERYRAELIARVSQSRLEILASLSSQKYGDSK